MQCPDCLGTGHERPYEPWEDCPTCDGSGSVDGGWADDDDDPNEGLGFDPTLYLNSTRWAR
jgi:hypothetical protein